MKIYPVGKALFYRAGQRADMTKTDNQFFGILRIGLKTAKRYSVAFPNLLLQSISHTN